MACIMIGYTAHRLRVPYALAFGIATQLATNAVLVPAIGMLCKCTH